ncbi:MAG TPA: hypothetical protein VFS25_12640 [Chitinophaga sp.]|uniref:hypothetical protein n=1 Tax=Chitinophaga sp. TaxID=1869181 RepID=UPI002DBE2010|nr:hypothetical protein [Chitinophaga sp.]HEU4553680.1 hypothetical protein [Chitinophaga sp.]
MTSSLILTRFAFIIATLTCEKAFTQTKPIASQENRFVKIYSRLASFIPANYDSVSFYTDKFEKEFTGFIKNNPATLGYPFKELTDSNFCNIATSDDGNFRIYSWDTQTGGTMHFFKTICQWRSNGKVFTKVPEREEGDAGSFCSRIFTVNTGHQQYYLAVTNAIFSTKNAMQSIAVYSIENNRLVDTVKLFRTKTQRLNKIDVPFDFFSVKDRPERPLELITYDNKQKIIYIPVVDDKGRVTRKYIVYQLKDHYFEFTGIAK